MTDLSKTIAPKSDQLNADDLIAGPKTITVTRVAAGNADQPIAVFFEGDNGKPWYPCKSMRRVLVELWGALGAEYTGRALTLYRDPAVKWGGIAVGGIRISHMSNISGDRDLVITESKTKRVPFQVRKLAQRAPQKQAEPEQPRNPEQVANYARLLEACATLEDIEGFKAKAGADTWHALDKREIGALLKARVTAIQANAADDFAG